MVQPETRYAKSGPVSIAYQVVGDGPVDLVLVPGFVSHVEVAWEEPGASSPAQVSRHCGGWRKHPFNIVLEAKA